MYDEDSNLPLYSPILIINFYLVISSILSLGTKSAILIRLLFFVKLVVFI